MSEPDAPRELLRRIRRICEMSAAIMRDGQRTGNWEGSEKVARQFDSITELVKKAEAQSEWQPIETAPKEGNFQICLDTCPHLSWPAHARDGDIYSNAHGRLNKPDHQGRITKATHWRPAYEPPRKSGDTP